MGKKVFSLCMAMALCLALLPATALAAETNTVYVGGVALAGSSGSIVYAITNESGEVITKDATADNYNIKWDGSTLTLCGATIKKELEDYGNPLFYIAGAAIGVFNQSGDANLTITLEGTNTIEDVSYGICVRALSTGSANLTIRGSGSLDVSATSTGIQIQSHSGDAAVSIKDSKVTATAQWASGVNVRCGTNSSASLTVNGGNLTSSGEPGILYDTLESSILSTIKFIVSNSALVDARGGGIGAGSLQDLKEVSPADDSVGIVFGHDRSDSKAGTVYGDVTLQEDLEIGEGETLTIPSGSSLNANGKLTNDGTINVENDGNLTGNPGGKVVYAPAITNHPQDVEVKENETANFTVEATGTDLSYQWQQSTDKGSSWRNIASATSDTYTTGKTTMDMSGTQYRCVVKNSIDEVTSDAATLTVTALPEPEPEPEPTPPPYIPPTYAVTTPETTGGTVTVSPSRASSGRTVTIIATPDLGYELESLTVLDSWGNEIALTDKGGGKYTFTMPASRVTVEATFTPAPLPFEDVAPGAWYESAVRYAYFHNIMEGMRETEFAPATALTRAMAVQILYNLEGQPDLSDENLGYPYEDVDAQAWYGNAVYWARITGVATGYGDGTFQPGDSITRQEFAQMLYNYAKYKGYDLSAEGDLSTFPDANSIADWAEAAMSWANGNQLINGHDDGTIDAAGIGTRAQAASILMKFDQNLVEN